MRGCKVQVSEALLLELLGLTYRDIRISHINKLEGIYCPYDNTFVFYFIGEDLEMPELIDGCLFEDRILVGKTIQTHFKEV